MRRYLALSTAALAATLVATAAVATGASAAGTPTTGTPTTTTPTSTTPTSTTPTGTTPAPTTPAPVTGSLKLYVAGAFFVDGHAVTVPHRALQVSGVVRPYVAGQSVTVKSFLGHHAFKTDQLRVKPSANQQFGTFTETLHSRQAGIVRVEVTHVKTPQMLGFFGERAVTALNTQAGFGSRGLFVDLIQQRLLALHFYMPQTGVYDSFTGLAIDAYHRLLGWGVAQTLDRRTINALLDGVGTFKVRFPHDGTHVEGNLGKQLLALIYGSKVYRIYPISSGKPSTPTILGHFRVYLRVPGYLPDGMYYSDFFYSGYAIHGYDPAPDYPASHGCMRLPIIDAISVFNWLTYGDVVDVYL
ncbi:MAG: L,D-transpeptidase [Solirubrobacteraceae bacterium]